MWRNPRNLKTWQLAILGFFVVASAANLYLSSLLDGRWPWFEISVALLAIMDSLSRVGVLPSPRQGMYLIGNQNALIAAFLCMLTSVAWMKFGAPLVPDPRSHWYVVLAPAVVLKVAFYWLLWVSVRNGIYGAWRRKAL
jgi:hypothetical protein